MTFDVELLKTADYQAVSGTRNLRKSICGPAYGAIRVRVNLLGSLMRRLSG